MTTRLPVFFALLSIACGETAAPPPPAAPPEPKVNRYMMEAEAAARLQAAKEKIREDMRKIGSAKVTLLKLVGPDDAKKADIEFEFTNHSERDLTSASGAIAFMKGDEEMKRIKVPFDKGVEAGKSQTKRGKFPLDPGNDGDQLIAKTPLKDLQMKWMPKYYRFADGETMESD